MRAQGIRSLVAAVSSVLAVGLIVVAGMQPGELSAVPVAPVVQPLSPMSVSSAQPDLPSLSDVRSLALADDGAPLISGAPVPSTARIPSAPTTPQEPEEAPGEDTTVLVKPSSVPTVPVPSVASTASGALLSMPIQGRKTSRFGMRFHPVRHIWKLHSGLDLAAPCGTPVGAAAPGTVVRTGWAGGNGYQVKVEHGKLGGRNVVTTYNHLSAIGVQVGQKVQTHQGLGRVGTTGFSTGCHLHFEVISDGQFTNPEPWLNGGAVVVDTLGMGTGKPGLPGSASPSIAGPMTPSASATRAPAVSSAPSPSPSAPATSVSASASPSPTPTPSPSPDATVTPTVTVTPCVSPSAAPEGAPNPCASASPTPPVVTSPAPNEGATPPPAEGTSPPPPAEGTSPPPPAEGTSPPPPAEGTSPPPEETSPSPTNDSSPSPTKDSSPSPTKVTSTPTKDASPTVTSTPTKDADATPSSTKPSETEGESTPEG